MNNRALISSRVTRMFHQLLLAVLAFILVAACDADPSQISTVHSQDAIQTAPSDAVRVVKHMMGETQVPANPQRVITLDTSHLATALVLGIQPIGSTAWEQVEHRSGFEPFEPYLSDRTQELTILGYGYTAREVNLEKVLLLKPDLILGNQDHKAIYKQLSRIAPTVLYNYSDDGDSWKDFMRSSAEALGKTQEAEKLLSDYHQRTQEFKQKMGVGVASSEENRASSIQVSVIHPTPYGTRLLYQDQFCSSVLQDVGLPRPPEQDKDGYGPEVSWEFIPQMGGDVIFVISFMDDESLDLVEQLKNHPLWSQLEAVKQGKVYPVDAEHWYGSDIVRANLILDDLFKYLLEEE